MNAVYKINGGWNRKRVSTESKDELIMKDGTFGTRKIQRTKQNNKVVVNNPSEDEQFCEVTGFPELNSSFTHPVPKNRLILKKIQHLPRKLFSHLHPPLSPKHKLAKNVRKTVGRRQQLKIAHRKEERRLQQELIEKENHDRKKDLAYIQEKRVKWEAKEKAAREQQKAGTARCFANEQKQQEAKLQ